MQSRSFPASFSQHTCIPTNHQQHCQQQQPHQHKATNNVANKRIYLSQPNLLLNILGKIIHIITHMLPNCAKFATNRTGRRGTSSALCCVLILRADSAWAVSARKLLRCRRDVCAIASYKSATTESAREISVCVIRLRDLLLVCAGCLRDPFAPPAKRTGELLCTYQ